MVRWGNGTLEGLVDRYRKFPGWLKNLLFLAGVLAALAVPDVLDGLLGGTMGTIAFFGVIAALLAIGLAGSIRTADPRQVMAENEFLNRPEGRARMKRVRMLLAGGIVLCLLLLAVISFLIVPGERGSQMELFLYGSGLLAAGLSLPLVVVAAGWAAGALLRPTSFSGEFVISMDGDPRAALAARADAEKVVGVSDGIGRAERLADGTGRYRLLPDGLLARLAGIDQVVGFWLAMDRSSLEIRTITKRGDSETLAYRVLGPAADGRARLSCRLDTRLGSALMKLVARLAGPKQLLNGGAQVEAQRFQRLTGATVTVAQEPKVLS